MNLKTIFEMINKKNKTFEYLKEKNVISKVKICCKRRQERSINIEKENYRHKNEKNANIRLVFGRKRFLKIVKWVYIMYYLFATYT